MVRIFKTADGALEQLEEPADGCWIALTDPTATEIFEIAQKFGIEVDDLRAPLDEEERSRIEAEDNYTPVSYTHLGTAEDVKGEAMTAIQKAAAGSRFILGSGCEIAVDAPLENVQALVKLGHGMPSSPAGRKQN